MSTTFDWLQADAAKSDFSMRQGKLIELDSSVRELGRHTRSGKRRFVGECVFRITTMASKAVDGLCPAPGKST